MTVVELYIDLIKKGIKTVDDVPEMIRSKVEGALSETPELLSNQNAERSNYVRRKEHRDVCRDEHD